MRPVITGFVLAGVLLAAAALTPMLLRPSAEVAAESAARQAQAALGELHDVDLVLGLAAARSNIEGLKSADAAALFSRSEADFQALGEVFQSLVRDAQTADRKRGQKPSNLRAVSLDAGALGALLAGLEKHDKENAGRLSGAARTLSDAARASDRVWLAAHLLGLARLTESGAALAQARQLRASVDTQAERLIADFSEWMILSGEKAQAAGLDSQALNLALTAALESASSELTRVNEQFSTLESQVQARTSELEGVRAELAAQRAALTTLETESFTPGQDAAFNAYRSRYTQIAGQLDSLQRREHLLAFGGLTGAKFADDDPLAGEISGDEVIIGLGELERQLAAARSEQSRLTTTQKELEARLGAAQSRAERAAAAVQSLDQKLAASEARLNATLEALLTTAAEASAREEEALRAAGEAGRSFRSAKTILDRMVADARKLASTYDKQSKNERLKSVQRGAEFGELLGTGAEAQAKAMLGRAHAERLAALLTLEDLLARVAPAIPDAAARVENLAEQRDAARTAAAEALSGAVADYDKLSQRGPQATRWISQAALAGVALLQAQVDSTNAPQHRVAAAQAIRTAVEGRQQSPYLSGHVLGLYALLSGTAAGEPASGPAESDAGSPASDDAADDSGG